MLAYRPATRRALYLPTIKGEKVDPNDYQKAAIRTERLAEEIAAILLQLGRAPDLSEWGRRNIRLLHGGLGLTTEIGELTTLFKKHVIYGQTLDTVKIKDEAGDILWYLALTLDAVGIKLSDVMEANISKLKVRFPERFTEELAADEGRDREAELEAMEGDSN